MKEKWKLFLDNKYEKDLEKELSELLEKYIKKNSVNFDRNILRCVGSGAAGAVTNLSCKTEKKIYMFFKRRNKELPNATKTKINK